jgi:hypothetical protein
VDAQACGSGLVHVTLRFWVPLVPLSQSNVWSVTVSPSRELTLSKSQEPMRVRFETRRRACAPRTDLKVVLALRRRRLAWSLKFE